jgi:hypothetical protein
MAQDINIPIRIISALGGPLISLVQGIIFAAIIERKQATSSYVLLSAYGVILKAKKRFTTPAYIEKKISGFLLIWAWLAISINRLLTIGIA